jgi:hypothetical protein
LLAKGKGGATANASTVLSTSLKEAGSKAQYFGKCHTELAELLSMNYASTERSAYSQLGEGPIFICKHLFDHQYLKLLQVFDCFQFYKIF